MKYTEDELRTWSAPLSQTEEARAENAIKMIKIAIAADDDLKSMDIEVFTQGSYANNTNVRTIGQIRYDNKTEVKRNRQEMYLV